MSAMKIIDSIHERGGTVTGFSSVCGGLPAPEAADNPLHYKFSWSPMGVLLASQNSAIYRINDKIEMVRAVMFETCFLVDLILTCVFVEI